MYGQAIRNRAALPTSYTTTFASTEDPISEGGIWLNGHDNGTINNNIKTSSGSAFGTAINNPAGPFDDSIAILNPTRIAIGPNQRVTTTIGRTGGYVPTNNHEVNHFVRGTMLSGSIFGYEANLSLKGDYGFIVLWKGGGNTNLSFFQQLVSLSHPNLVDGDVLVTEVSGNVIVVKLNGSSLGSYDTVNDVALFGAKWNSGSCGIDVWAETGSTLTSAGFKDFLAETLP